MNDNQITIKKIEKKERDFIAYYKSDFLNATYSVVFSDTVFGAVALTRFYEMIKFKFNTKDLNINISDNRIRFKHDDILKLLTPQRSSV